MTPLSADRRALAEAHADLIPIAASRSPSRALDRGEKLSAAGLGLIEAAGDPRAPGEPAAFRRFALTRMRWRILQDARTATDHWRKTPRAPMGPVTANSEPDPNEVAANPRDPVKALVDPWDSFTAIDLHDEFTTVVAARLALFTPRQQAGIALHLEGLSIPEIAGRLGVTESTAWNDRNATIRRLRAALAS